jgi:hypothetical protein
MTIPVTGALSFNNINVETATTATWQLSLDHERFRNLAGGSSTATQVSLSVHYGASHNGFYFYPRQNSINTLLAQGTRNAAYLPLYLASDGSVGAGVAQGTPGYITPSRWYTPITASIATSYQFRLVQTGATRTGTATNDTWQWLFGTPASVTGQAYPNIGFDSGWQNGPIPGDIIFLNQGANPANGSFDVTVTGNVSIRQTASPATLITKPFTFRIYAP